MKRTLSSEAAGTLIALRDLYRIKNFSPECGEELCARGFAVLKGRHLAITEKGLRKAEKLYGELGSGLSADEPSAEAPLPPSLT